MAKRPPLPNAGTDKHKTLSRVRWLYRAIQGLFGGCDGSEGSAISGCLNASSQFQLTDALKLEGERVFDIGAGEGRILGAAALAGAESGFGVEINAVQGCMFNLILTRMSMEFPELNDLSVNFAFYVRNIFEVVIC